MRIPLLLALLTACSADEEARFALVVDITRDGAAPVRFEAKNGWIGVALDEERFEGLYAANTNLDRLDEEGSLGALDWLFAVGVYRGAPEFTSGTVVTATYDPVLAMRDHGTFVPVEHDKGEHLELRAVDDERLTLVYEAPLAAMSPGFCLSDDHPCPELVRAPGALSLTLSGPWSVARLD